jgi:hypothetical protein
MGGFREKPSPLQEKKNEKMKNLPKSVNSRKHERLTKVWQIRKLYENYKFHKSPGSPENPEVSGNPSYPEIPDNSNSPINKGFATLRCGCAASSERSKAFHPSIQLLEIFE